MMVMVTDADNEITLFLNVFQPGGNNFSETVFPHLLSKLTFIHGIQYILVFTKLCPPPFKFLFWSILRVRQ